MTNPGSREIFSYTDGWSDIVTIEYDTKMLIDPSVYEPGIAIVLNCDHGDGGGSVNIPAGVIPNIIEALTKAYRESLATTAEDEQK